MRALMLGNGEIGKGMVDILSITHTIGIHDPAKGLDISMRKDLYNGQILLVAFPYTEDDFIDDVRYWQNSISPAVTIIFSTVPVGTSRELDACHFPIEAKHPHIARDVMLDKNHVLGGYNSVAVDFLWKAGLKFKVLMNPDHSEFLKLRSTAIYGLNIEFARYSANVAKKIGLDYSIIKEYDRGHNELTAARGTPEHTRYLIDAPEGNIGGHCVVPNAKILDKQFPSIFLKEIYREKD